MKPFSAASQGLFSFAPLPKWKRPIYERHFQQLVTYSRYVHKYQHCVNESHCELKISEGFKRGLLQLFCTESKVVVAAYIQQLLHSRDCSFSKVSPCLCRSLFLHDNADGINNVY